MKRRMNLAVSMFLGLLAPVVGQEKPAASSAADLVAKLAGADDLVRELARRQLALAKDFPTDRVAQLLGSSEADVVVAAATLLVDRKLETKRLRRLVKHDFPVVRRAVLPALETADVVRMFRQDSRADLRRDAMFELEDRGALEDGLFLEALRAGNATVADPAMRIMVFERSPFPIALADKMLELAPARRRLLGWLAERPRARSGPWLQKVLAQKGLDALERLLAIQGLPAAWLDRKLGLEVLRAAVSERPELSNRAAAAAGRFPHELADRLAAEVIKMLGDAPTHELLGCLSQVSPVGEKLLFDHAVQAGGAARRDISHWLGARDSSLVTKFVADALDADGAFPPELVGLTGPALRTGKKEHPGRIAKVVAILDAGGKPAIEAFTALIEAEVFRPAMAAYAEAGVAEDKARRLFRLFKLPPEKLPLDLFLRIFEGEDADAHVYAANALGRAPVDRKLEKMLLEFAMGSQLPLLQMASSRALILYGSEAAGRKVFVKLSRNPLVYDWLIQRPKPWSHELLLKARAGMEPEKKGNAEDYHKVLIALAKLGDRGAYEELVTELPKLQPFELREAQRLIGRYYKRVDLERLAKKYLAVQKLAKGEELSMEPEDERRGELIAWFNSRKELNLEPLLLRLWEADKSYEVRLAALRGLLARGSVSLHERLVSLIRKPFSEAREELAFEVVGSMEHPLTEKSLQLLAQILLVAPLTDPPREVRFSVEQGYDSARGAYPLITPIANLLRRDEAVRPGPVFAAVAQSLGGERYAINRQRLGLFLVALAVRTPLLDELGPVLAELILAAPDRNRDFEGLAQLVLADRDDAKGDHAAAARRYRLASRAICRGYVPEHIQRSFLGDADPASGFHPYAAVAARAAICRARGHFAAGERAAGQKALRRAWDLAEGDRATTETITKLRNENR